MPEHPFIPLRHQAATKLLAPALAILLAMAATARAASDQAFPSALADLQRQFAETEVLGTTIAKRAAMNDRFFERVPLASLGPREIAELTRLNAFAQGTAAQDRARAAAAQLASAMTMPDVNGALAAAVRVELSRAAGVKGTERAEWIAAALHHPAFDALVRGEFGDVAIDAGCVAGMRDPAYRDDVTAIAGKLDPASPAAANSVGNYWGKIQEAIPPGERRQLLRGQLATYLAGVLNRAGTELTPEHRAKIEVVLARLNSVVAQGETIDGKPAPELHFVWSSEANWQKLSDLRGKVVVLDFWATWCGSCVRAFPKVAKLAERYRGSDVVVLGVTSLQGAIMGLGSKTEDCRGQPDKEIRLMTAYMRERQMTWPVVFSREPVINPEYGLRGIPTTMVIAPDGTMRHSQEGFDDVALITQIDAIVREFRLRGPAMAAK